MAALLKSCLPYKKFNFIEIDSQFRFNFSILYARIDDNRTERNERKEQANEPNGMRSGPEAWHATILKGVDDNVARGVTCYVTRLTN